MTTPAYEARAAAEAAEYGTYVAVATIYFDGLPAYRAGMAVPVSNVVLHGYEEQGLVRRVDAAPVEQPAPVEPAPVEQPAPIDGVAPLEGLPPVPPA